MHETFSEVRADSFQLLTVLCNFWLWGYLKSSLYQGNVLSRISITFLVSLEMVCAMLSNLLCIECNFWRKAMNCICTDIISYVIALKILHIISLCVISFAYVISIKLLTPLVTFLKFHFHMPSPVIVHSLLFWQLLQFSASGFDANYYFYFRNQNSTLRKAFAQNLVDIRSEVFSSGRSSQALLNFNHHILSILTRHYLTVARNLQNISK